MSTGHDYTALHGTQAQQAAAQSRAVHEVDGPWRLERWAVRDGKPERVTLDNSVRSTRAEAEALQAAQERATDIRWAIVPC